MSEIIEISKGEYTLKISHNYGFFSNCTVVLICILSYFNKSTKLPNKIDTNNSFYWYKPPDKKNEDIRSIYFTENDSIEIHYSHFIRITLQPDFTRHFVGDEQYSNYKYINFSDILPFIQKYFNPSIEIQNLTQKITNKYNINYENTCAVFYRGNDKATECILPDYGLFIDECNKILRINPQITFLLQSDETEFLDIMQKNFPNSLILQSEIRHMKRNLSTVDHVFNTINPVMSKNFLAIQIIMSKCKYIVCTSGNCSLWTVLFRGNCNRVTQI